MRRRDLLIGALNVPLQPIPLLAQTPERVWRVGLLTPNQFSIRTFRQLNLPELAKPGFVEGAISAFRSSPPLDTRYCTLEDFIHQPAQRGPSVLTSAGWDQMHWTRFARKRDKRS